jgi:3-deoxy-D-manno-octulosonic acid kinase
VREASERTADGAILFDADVLRKVTPAAFVAGNWEASEPVTGTLRTAGRGKTMIVRDGDNEFVLRHYLRGGLAGKIVRDRYVWLGEGETRCFAEFRLLAKLSDLGLPVPQPAAAYYRRHGPLYSADLLTVRLPGVCSLADRLVARESNENFWREIGAGISHFHSAGVFHADLNVYNVQLNDRDEMYLLDFDQGKMMQAGPWRQKNLARFHRSLRKLKATNPATHFSDRDWNWFLLGYFDASRSA